VDAVCVGADDEWLADRLFELDPDVELVGAAVPPPPPVTAPHAQYTMSSRTRTSASAIARRSQYTPGGSGPVGRNSVLTPAG
jgi:hypothetical protein